jgi:dTDP-4-amino-4,6-dideoxygalactose transaminase
VSVSSKRKAGSVTSSLEQTDIEPVPSTGLLLGDRERAAVERVLSSGMLAQGPEVDAFENEFAQYMAGRPCVAVSSGTSALLLALVAAGIGRGDEVIVPSFSFAATANAVTLAGARPVFVDIEPAHFCIDPAAVLAAITPRTAAVMPVHLYGHPAAMGELTRVAEAHDLVLIEDAAQAHLARLRDTPVGTFGAAAAFSFYPTKNMTTGEGGLVVCANESIARRVRLLRNQGMERRYQNELVGYNARMSDLHAAIGRAQLGRLTGWTAARRHNADFLTDSLTDADEDGRITLPRVAPGALPVWHQYTVRSPCRDELVATLAALGIPTGVYYPTPIHRLPAYDLVLDLPHTAAAAREVLSLPVHPALSSRHLDRIVSGVEQGVAR